MTSIPKTNNFHAGRILYNLKKGVYNAFRNQEQVLIKNLVGNFDKIVEAKF